MPYLDVPNCISIRPSRRLPVPNPSLVWEGCPSCASKDILWLGQASDSSWWCERQMWCQEQLPVHRKNRHTNTLDFSARLALVTSLCHMKETGNPSPPWTGQHFLSDFSWKARKPFRTSKRLLNLNNTAMPARRDGNLVTRNGLLLRNYIWALSTRWMMESFPNKTESHSICPPVCKGMIPTAHPLLPAGGWFEDRRPSWSPQTWLPLSDPEPEGWRSRFRHALSLAWGWRETTLWQLANAAACSRWGDNEEPAAS